MIVFGYLLLRPILIRYGAKLQQRQLEKEDSRAEVETKRQRGLPDKAKGEIQWGAKARARQQKAMEKALANVEDSDSDDLEELLE
jgi:Protein trafficking PGA2